MQHKSPSPYPSRPAPIAEITRLPDGSIRVNLGEGVIGRGPAEKWRAFATLLRSVSGGLPNVGLHGIDLGLWLRRQDAAVVIENFDEHWPLKATIGRVLARHKGEPAPHPPAKRTYGAAAALRLSDEIAGAAAE